MRKDRWQNLGRSISKLETMLTMSHASREPIALIPNRGISPTPITVKAILFSYKIETLCVYVTVVSVEVRNYWRSLTMRQTHFLHPRCQGHSIRCFPVRSHYRPLSSSSLHFDHSHP